MSKNNYSSDRRMLLSIDPSAIYNKGHNFAYQESIKKTADYLGLEFLALVPIENKLLLPNFFLKFNVSSVIKGGRKAYKSKAILTRFIDLCLFKVTIFRAINLLNKKNKIDVVIIDGANLLQEIILIIFLKKYHIYTILIKREEVKKSLFFKLIYIFQSYIFRYGTILTDSDVLSDQLKYFFNRVKVVPIPHTEECIGFANLNDESYLKIIWPGEPRPEKGLHVIKKLVNYLENNYVKSVVLKIPVIAEVSHKVGNSALEILNDKLSREEYLYHLSNSDVVILPYDKQKYEGRTSGIFVEAIFMNKIPLVSSGTWMSFELNKYNLDELIVSDWDIDPKAIIEKVFFLNGNLNTRQKIIEMSMQYKLKHSNKNYTQQLSKIIFDCR